MESNTEITKERYGLSAYVRLRSFAIALFLFFFLHAYRLLWMAVMIESTYFMREPSNSLVIIKTNGSF